MPTNVLGTELQCCCRTPVTGFYRDGYCRTGPEDVGQHTVCVQVTEEFLDFSVLDGNDLVTPHPEWGFPGLKPGDPVQLYWFPTLTVSSDSPGEGATYGFYRHDT